MQSPSLPAGASLAAGLALASALVGCGRPAQLQAPAPPALLRASAPPAPGPSVQAVSASECGEAPAFRWPARGRVNSPFGPRGGRLHAGIDISPSHHDLGVRAAAAGTVRFSDRRAGYGKTIILTHAGGYQTLYAHNQDNLVRKGARVAQGQVIADMGSSGHVSGPHLHFEIRRDGRPIDPLPCLPPHRQAPR